MVRDQKQSQTPTRRGLIVGNYCHDVLIKDGVVLAQSLGGAVSFISVVLDGLSIPYNPISKVGDDFAYATNLTHDPIVIPNSRTTSFHAYFDSRIEENGHRDRVLKRVCACDPIRPSDLPEAEFDFGMAVGVGGEILPETLEKMLEICNVVFVDIQALIREFDADEGTVKLVGLKNSGFVHLLPKIGFLKASAEEAVYMDIEELRKLCCVVVTNGKDGCKVHWKDGEMQIAPFVANQVDPTGAGDSFLGGFVAGLVQGLAVPDAALMGNLFGSLTVAQIGLQKFDLRMLQRVKDEVQRRKILSISRHERIDGDVKFMKPPGHELFHMALNAAKLTLTCPIQECHQDLSSTSPITVERHVLPQYAGQPKSLLSSVYDETIQTGEGNP